MDLKIATWNIRGLSNSDKQKEVKKFIAEEKLQMCAILETHVKYNKVKKLGDNVFGSWDYVTNAEDNNKGCRIMMGWDQNMVDVWVINKSKQSMLLLIEIIGLKKRLFCTIIYASNSGMERRRLWNDLGAYKQITNGTAWVIMGDFNVTLEASEHSNGSSMYTSDMIEFKKCVEEVEIEDILSSGFHYTWTKSLKNPKCKTLKKLDRVMINERFMDTFTNAHSIFLPYIISDHSPALLVIPNGGVKKKKAFRMSNFITEKEEFLNVVKNEWGKSIAGFQMYKVTQKMKLMKHKLNKLSWKNGNVHDRVEVLRGKVKTAQDEVDKHPFCEERKKQSCKVLQEYCEAVRDEDNLLKQKAKIEWLKEGDRNTKFFHKILKSRQHKSRIMTICDENGASFENEHVAVKFWNIFISSWVLKMLLKNYKEIIFPSTIS